MTFVSFSSIKSFSGLSSTWRTWELCRDLLVISMSDLQFAGSPVEIAYNNKKKKWSKDKSRLNRAVGQLLNDQHVQISSLSKKSS